MLDLLILLLLVLVFALGFWTGKTFKSVGEAVDAFFKSIFK